MFQNSMKKEVIGIGETGKEVMFHTLLEKGV